MRPAPLRWLLAALLFSSGLSAAQPISREQVLSAIHVFESKACGSLGGAARAADEDRILAEASNTILRFALESDDVVVDIGTDAVPWCDLHKGLAGASQSSSRGLLLAAYLSGCVRSQLEGGRKDANPYAGWKSMLKVYRVLKEREDLTLAEVEPLLARQKDGSLEAYAAQTLITSTEKLQKAYRAGQSESAPAPGSR